MGVRAVPRWSLESLPSGQAGRERRGPHGRELRSGEAAGGSGSQPAGSTSPQLRS